MGCEFFPVICSIQKLVQEDKEFLVYTLGGLSARSRTLFSSVGACERMASGKSTRMRTIMFATLLQTKGCLRLRQRQVSSPID